MLKTYQRLQAKPLNAYLLMFIVAVFLLISANYTFFMQAAQVYPVGQAWAFLGSLALVLLGVLLLLIALLGYRWTLKAVLVLFIMTAAITSHFTDTYGTVYDTTMLQNALQTDHAESKDLMSVGFIVRVLLLGVLPSIFIIRQRLVFPPLKKSLGQRALVWLTSLGLIAVPILAFSQHYASFFREHKPLRMYSNPIAPIYSMGKLASIEYKKFAAPKHVIPHADDAVQVSKPDSRKPKLIVMVVGETARADHISFNGYARDTFPQLAKVSGLTNFSNVTSCGTSTAYSVPCMFSYVGMKDYDVDSAPYQENVLDTLHRLGIGVLWRDNNSDSKGVMDRLPSANYVNYKIADNNPICDTNSYKECRDVGMLVGLDEYVKTQTGDTLIVLHQMGNHGPAYFKRYDDAFAKFTPVCESNELAKCAPKQVINAYDNALLATDDFLTKTIDWLKAYDDSREVAMLYVSDHGESLGEKGVYLHGMPNAFAPNEQRQVPAFFWAGANANLHAVAGDSTLSHDAITPTLLKLFDVKSSHSTKPSFIQ